LRGQARAFPSSRLRLSPDISRCRMLSSHPSIGGSNARLNLTDVFQQMASSGGVSSDLLHNGGLVNDLINSSGMDKQSALNNLSEAFNLLNGHVQNTPPR
jgi:hypothetical protein